MEELKELIRRGNDEVHGLRAEVAGMRKAYRRSRLVNTVITVVFVACLGVGGYAVYTSREAAKQAAAGAQRAGQTADCLNGVLANRVPVTQQDQAAHIAFAHATVTFTRVQQMWVQSVKNLTTTRPGSNAQARAVGQFTVISNLFAQAAAAYTAAAQKWQTTLDADENIKSAHPLGRC